MLIFNVYDAECALYPWIVLSLGLVLVVSLMYGVTYVEIVIDPVELWASKTSQCREERQYFNDNFGPFYRIQQVIATPVGLEKVVYYWIYIYYVFFFFKTGNLFRFDNPVWKISVYS